MKRMIDLMLSLAGLAVLAPVMALIAALVRIRFGPPVFFKHQRPGLYGTPFLLIKFRTMTDARGPDNRLLPDPDRLLPFGRFLRAWSLDELPTLVNVLKGEMSFVGPRPLLMEYLPLYSPAQMRRHEVKPGITGWAQVNGRNTLSWEEKFKLDAWYVEHGNVLVDLKILAMTFLKVARRDGVSAASHVTMPRFTGTNAKGTQDGNA